MFLNKKRRTCQEIFDPARSFAEFKGYSSDQVLVVTVYDDIQFLFWGICKFTILVIVLLININNNLYDIITGVGGNGCLQAAIPVTR